MEKQPLTRKYTLPALGYDYAALEPHLDGKLMELHHDKHHRAYVDGANETMDRLQSMRQREDFTTIAQLERALAFNLSGHVLHSIFWQNLSPDGGEQPEGELAQAIRRDFGSFLMFRKQLVHAASTIMGSGWGALIWDPIGQRLTTVQIHDHQSVTVQAAVPLMVLDAWEHAYYLQYHNDKARYFEAIWSLWNWQDVSQRFASARKLDLMLSDAAERM